MKQVQRGFTLIELVMVIVILGVLAAVALPKFVDLKGDAQIAAAQGTAGALASASSINYATCQINGTANAKCVAVTTNCSELNQLLQTGVTATYNITGILASGTTASTCAVQLSSTPAVSATFVGIKAP